jgi:hypothetical protein
MPHHYDEEEARRRGSFSGMFSQPGKNIRALGNVLSRGNESGLPDTRSGSTVDRIHASNREINRYMPREDRNPSRLGELGVAGAAVVGSIANVGHNIKEAGRDILGIGEREPRYSPYYGIGDHFSRGLAGFMREDKATESPSKTHPGVIGAESQETDRRLTERATKTFKLKGDPEKAGERYFTPSAVAMMDQNRRDMDRLLGERETKARTEMLDRDRNVALSSMTRGINAAEKTARNIEQALGLRAWHGHGPSGIRAGSMRREEREELISGLNEIRSALPSMYQTYGETAGLPSADISNLAEASRARAEGREFDRQASALPQNMEDVIRARAAGVSKGATKDTISQRGWLEGKKRMLEISGDTTVIDEETRSRMQLEVYRSQGVPMAPKGEMTGKKMRKWRDQLAMSIGPYVDTPEQLRAEIDNIILLSGF